MSEEIAILGGIAIIGIGCIAGIPLCLLIDKAVECFSSKESEQPDGSLGGEMDAEGSRKTCLG
ncbi:hypothetical protein [Wolbachia endosymbiont (group E) of Neria commutata]|uniref:hypothetical protein n=1 Tax=Wolbachia endosymbiont (group E) of Neria commutata TaxID=3066149 RepID=UPI003132DCE3